MEIFDDEITAKNHQTTKQQTTEDNHDPIEVTNVTVEGYNDNEYAL